MNKNLLLARSNLRKGKGQTVTIIVLVLLASVMMNLWLSLATDYKQNFDRCHDRLNDGHVTLSFEYDENVVDFLKNELDNSSYVEEYSVTDSVSFNLCMLDKDTALSREVGKFEIVEEGEYTSGIYLPVLCKGDEPYQTQIGEEYTIGYTIGSNDNYKTYTVCGFVNNAMVGSNNCGLTGALLTSDKYQELCEQYPLSKLAFTSIRLKDASKSRSFENEIKNTLLDKFPDLSINSNSYEMVSTTRYVSQSICAAIISAMAFIIILIALVVISSNVVNYIKENMQNLGALKAVGYKSTQLIGAQIVQFSLVVFISSAVGVGLSYTVFPYIADMMNQQTGIPYEVRFLPLPCIITIAFIVGTVAAAVYLSARGIKKIEPITALRQGISTHSFKKNHIPLDKTKFSPNAALALKTTFSGVKQNITVCVTMLVLSLIIVFVGVMFKNVIADQKPFLNLVMGEYTDYAAIVEKANEEEFVREIQNDSRVEKLYQFNQNIVLHRNSSELSVRFSDDFSKINNQQIIIEGRFPKYKNETAIGAKYAKDNGLKIGEEITLSHDGKSADYLITGYTQYVNLLGEDCLLTNEGFEMISDNYVIANYIEFKEDTDIDVFDSEIRERFGEKILLTDMVQRLIDEQLGVYTSLVMVIVIAIMILSGLIIVFVLYLLVKMLMNNKKRDYGILKAMGYTTGQLVFQTALSFMPTVIISTAVGIIISSFVVNPFIVLFLSGIGVVKSTFEISVMFNIVAGIGLILFIFVIACLMSLKIRKISPCSMLSGE